MIKTYEKYLEQKSKYEKELYLYETKKEEGLNKVVEYISRIVPEDLASLGLSFSVDTDKLNDEEYLRTMIPLITELCDSLEVMGKELMEV